MYHFIILSPTMGIRGMSWQMLAIAASRMAYTQSCSHPRDMTRSFSSKNATPEMQRESTVSVRSRPGVRLGPKGGVRGYVEVKACRERVWEGRGGGREPRRGRRR